MSRVISWFSCGAASAIATKLSPDAVPVYCETGAEHPGNERFLEQCEAWFSRRQACKNLDAEDRQGDLLAAE